MKRTLVITLLTLVLALVTAAQPGPVRAELDKAIASAVEKPRIKNGHFYAKCNIERRWISAYLDGHPTVSLVVIDDSPRWYEFLSSGKKVHGFYFDLRKGSDLGPVSRLDKGLAAAMRRALLDPQQAAVGLNGDTVVYFLAQHIAYKPERFERWMESQRLIPVPWVRREKGDSITLAFVTLEQERAFRRKDLFDRYENFVANAQRPLASYLIDFNWYGKTNFLIEANGIVFNDSLFSTYNATGVNTTIVKDYDLLYVWENGFLRGVYSLSQLPGLTAQWKDFTSLPPSVSSHYSVKSIRQLPFNERKHGDLLARHEDSLYTRHRIIFDSTGEPNRDLLDQYFTIYGKTGTAHTGDIENTLYTLARKSMPWGQYYLQTYTRRQGRHYDEIDDLAFDLVRKDFSQAQTYRDLFPLGRHLDEADEIITFQKACRLYDVKLYASKYPYGRYADRFDEYMRAEEERLYNEGLRIYDLNDAYDIELTLRNTISTYLQHFPKGRHLKEVNEMHAYGSAVQRRNATLYTSQYSIRSAHGQHLRKVLANISPNTPVANIAPVAAKTVKEADDKAVKTASNQAATHWIHKQILDMPVSQYTNLVRLGNGDFQVSSIHIDLATTRKRSCQHNHPCAITVSYDPDMGLFYIADGAGRKHLSDSVFLTVKEQMLEGYDDGNGILWDIEQWFLQNCRSLPNH